MSKQDRGYDHDRYRKLLAEATDESKRLALIDVLIEEGARDKLIRERISRLGLTKSPERPHNPSSSVPDVKPPPANERGEVG
jgi:hypothetical protein